MMIDSNHHQKTSHHFQHILPNYTQRIQKQIIAKKKLRETISNSTNLRRQHLFDLALALELNGEFKQVKVI